MPTPAKPAGIVTAFEAKTRFGSLLRRVALGEEIIITRHDQPVARIVPETTARKLRSQFAAGQLLELSRLIASRPDYVEPTDEEINAAIERGRR